MVDNYSYSPVGDAITLILATIIVIIQCTTYSKKDTKLKVLTWIIHQSIIAAFLNLMSNGFKKMGMPLLLSESIKWMYYVFLTMLLITFLRYLAEAFELPTKDGWKVFIFSVIPASILTIMNLIHLIKYSYTSMDLFRIVYVFFVVFLGLLLFWYRKYIYKNILRTFTIVLIYDCIIAMVSFFAKNTSFLTFSYLVPGFTIFYLLHNNSFSLDLGMFDTNAFFSYLEELYQKNKKFMMISLSFDATSKKDNNIMKKVKTEFYDFYGKYLSKSYTFKVGNNKNIVIIEYDKYNKIEFDKIYLSFMEMYEHYEIDYKLITVSSNELLNKTNSYLKFIEFLENNMDFNTYYISTEREIGDFINHEYIASELADIFRCNNLNDDRVLVYCQPVYNTMTKRYDTAEVLMRLNLKKIGMVFPDNFIHIAENEGYIHILTKIILNKACRQIKEFERNNYIFNRISVNVSLLEMKNEAFCSEISDIIKANDIEFSKVAIELTESNDDIDSEIVKERIMELRKLGIKFYLDDFGTGYSNFERILKLSIDIVKFDRSLVILSSQNREYKYMVKNFTHIFKTLGYKALFEGVETSSDEDLCIEIGADYLQGYKYSKPIPFDEFSKFLD